MITTNVLLFPTMVLALITCSVASDFNDHSRIPDERNDYCQSETFNPRCWKNEVIIMQSAIYGRMQAGRCLEDSKLMEITRKDPRYLGCSADVLAILDRRCSGKVHCDVRLPENELENTKPCYRGLEMFLEASYSCISVVDNDRSCLIPVTSSPQHILGYPASSIGCGGKTQPWILEAPIGQRINISMIELHGNVLRNANPRCDQYGYILEKSHKKNVSICSSVERERNVFVSVANMVEIVFTVNQEDDNTDTVNFIMRFEAIGCSDLVPPEDAWLKRSTDEAIVGCYSSRQTWQLRCNGRQWIGVLGNCSHASTFEALTTKENKSDHQDYLLWSMVVIAAFAPIALSFLCLYFIHSHMKDYLLWSMVVIAAFAPIALSFMCLYFIHSHMKDYLLWSMVVIAAFVPIALSFMCLYFIHSHMKGIGRKRRDPNQIESKYIHPRPTTHAESMEPSGNEIQGRRSQQRNRLSEPRTRTTEPTGISMEVKSEYIHPMGAPPNPMGEPSNPVCDPPNMITPYSRFYVKTESSETFDRRTEALQPRQPTAAHPDNERYLRPNRRGDDGGRCVVGKSDVSSDQATSVQPTTVYPDNEGYLKPNRRTDDGDKNAVGKSYDSSDQAVSNVEKGRHAIENDPKVENINSDHIQSKTDNKKAYAVLCSRREPVRAVVGHYTSLIQAVENNGTPGTGHEACSGAMGSGESGKDRTEVGVTLPPVVVPDIEIIE